MISSLINDLKEKNIQLTCENGKLKYFGPEKEITQDLLNKLKENKAELINYLSNNYDLQQIKPKESLVEVTKDAGKLYTYLQSKGYKFYIENCKLLHTTPEGTHNEEIELAISRHYRRLYQLFWPMPNANLTPIQPEGNGDPFIIVHGEEATAFFQDIFGTDLPLFDYFHQSCDGHRMKYQKVEEVTDIYLKQLLTVKSEGRYFLAGYSFGGLVAFEMAHRLKDMGKKVELLVIIDTAIPNYKGYYHTFKFFSVLRRFKILIKAPIERWIKSFFLRIYCRIILLRGKAIPSHLRPFYIVDNYMQNFDLYKPVPYEGDLYLITSQNSYKSKDQYLGWKKFIKGNIELIQVNGTHREIMQNPETVKWIAKNIKTKIQRIK